MATLPGLWVRSASFIEKQALRDLSGHHLREVDRLGDMEVDGDTAVASAKANRRRPGQGSPNAELAWLG